SRHSTAGKIPRGNARPWLFANRPVMSSFMSRTMKSARCINTALVHLAASAVRPQVFPECLAARSQCAALAVELRSGPHTASQTCARECLHECAYRPQDALFAPSILEQLDVDSSSSLCCSVRERPPPLPFAEPRLLPTDLVLSSMP